MQKLNAKLKNIALILVGVIMLLVAVDYAAGKLAGYMTQYQTYGYTIKLTK